MSATGHEPGGHHPVAYDPTVASAYPVTRNISQALAVCTVPRMVDELFLTISIALGCALLGWGAVHLSAKIPMRPSRGTSDRWRDSARERDLSGMVE